METLNQVVKSFNEESVRLDVRIKGTGFLQVLRNIGLIKSKRSFVIRPFSLATMTRISLLICSFVKEKITSENFLQTVYGVVSSDAKAMAEIVALAVTNAKEKPDNELIDFFYHNLTAKELNSIVQHVVTSLDLKSFMTCIVSVKGIQILETNPILEMR